MIFRREGSRTVYDLPLGMTALFVGTTAFIVDVAPLRLEHAGAVLLDLFFFLGVVVQFRVTSRTEGELVTLSCTGRKRWSLRDYVARVKSVQARTPRSPSLYQLEVFHRHSSKVDECVATIAVVNASPRGRAKLEAIARLLDLKVSW